MIRVLPAAAFVCSLALSHPLKSQDASSSGELSRKIVERGVELHEEEKYEDALQEFAKVHRNDSNYYLASVEALNTMLVASKFKEGLELCDQLLKEKNEYTPNILVYKGDFLDHLGRQTDSKAVFNAGRKAYPLNHSFVYEEAVLELRQKNADRAFELLTQALQMNPFHTASHIQMGLFAFRQNQRVAALLAYQFCLLMDPGSSKAKNVVTYMEKIAKMEVEPDTAYNSKVFEGQNDFSELESVLRSKVALGSKFKSKTDLPFDLTKQMQMIIEGIPNYKSEKGFYNSFYGKFFSVLQEKGYLEPCLYSSLREIGLEKVDKWLEKHKKEVDEFESWGYNYICTEMAKFPEDLNGKTVSAPHWYYRKAISSVGLKDNKEQNTGYWKYYYRNGIIKAEGNYVNGQKDGNWKYYNEQGSKTSEETMRNGETVDYKSYYDNSNPKIQVPLSKETMNGEKKTYYSNGNMYSTTPYTEGKISGKQVYYHRNGAKQYEINNKDGVLSGDLVEYYDNGMIFQKGTLVNGNFEGASKHFYNNAANSIYYEGNYKKGKSEGEWKYYFRDGKVSEIRIYKDGKLDGLNTEYYQNGKPKSEDTYSDGKLDGVCKTFSEEGKLTQEFQYRKGKLLGYRAYKKDGTKICDNKIDGKNFALTLYHPNGSKRREGKVSDGDLEGIWKDFDLFGTLSQESNYKEGRLNGIMKVYYPDGKVKSETTYLNGDETGKYKAYHINGKQKVDGDFVDGKKTGYWNWYHIDGSLSTREYYQDGTLDGWSEYYAVNGKLGTEEQHKEECLVKVLYFDTAGTLLQNVDLPGGTGLLEKKNKEGHVLAKRNYAKDLEDGESVWYYPGSQKVLSKIKYKAGKREGDNLSYDIYGNLSSKATYFNDERQGVKEDYNLEGKLISKQTYVNGDLEGEYLNYYGNGKISSSRKYENDEVEGESDMYDESGELVYKRYFHNGLLTGYTYYDKAGQLMPLKEMPGGETNIICYFKNGKKSFQAGYLNGELHGKRSFYNSTGTLTSEGDYYHGYNHGVEKEFFASGTLKAKRNYEYGELNGLAVTYYENGKVQSEKSYLNGSQHGWTKYYDQTGKLVVSYYYSDGWPIIKG